MSSAKVVITANLGITYMQLGLHRRARRLVLNADEIYRRVGALPNRVNVFSILADVELAMGHLDSARAHIAEAGPIERGARPACPRLGHRDGARTARVA